LRKGILLAAAALGFAALANGQANPTGTSTAPQTSANSPAPTPAQITLDDAIRMALLHNHALQAMRTTIQQSQAEEVTANLRPNPTLGLDAQFLPIFQPNQFSSDYID